jgi:hypothetical protein
MLTRIHLDTGPTAAQLKARVQVRGHHPVLTSGPTMAARADTTQPAPGKSVTAVGHGVRGYSRRMDFPHGGRWAPRRRAERLVWPMMPKILKSDQGAPQLIRYTLGEAHLDVADVKPAPLAWALSRSRTYPTRCGLWRTCCGRVTQKPHKISAVAVLRFGGADRRDPYSCWGDRLPHSSAVTLKDRNSSARECVNEVAKADNPRSCEQQISVEWRLLSRGSVTASTAAQV